MDTITNTIQHCLGCLKQLIKSGRKCSNCLTFFFVVVVVDDIIVYFPNPIDSSQNYLELSKGLGGNNGHTINIKIKNHMQCGRLGFDPCVGMIPCRRERLPTPVF